MPTASPPLTAEHVAYLANAATILVGTCNPALQPEGVRGVGIRVHPDRMRVSVLVPTILAARTLDNLTATPRIAITTAAYPTFSSIQLKGLARGVRDASPTDDRALADAFQARFETEFAWANVVARQVRLTTWPCKLIDVDIETIYVEAPAPVDAPAQAPKARP